MSGAAPLDTGRRIGGESGDRGSVDIETGTYEILHARLREHAAEVARRAELLNERRIAAFGGSELTLLGTERIRTGNNCVPRDVVALPDGRMVFGYNVFVGMRPETTVADVFAVHRFRTEGATPDGAGPNNATPNDTGPNNAAPGAAPFGFESADATGLFDDPRFLRDFAELYRYYSQTRLLQLRRVEGRLLAVFQTGQRTDDIRVLRWQLDTDGSLRYLDNRGERDHVFPASHDFDWIETTRDDQVHGRHPHLSILGEVFVETLGGTLTIKVEDNTETGAGIYSEPVDEPLQSLADADVHYARLGPLILLRIRPYNETDWRHLVFNTRTKDVVRLDGIGQSCRRLPEDQGIIFPGGYYLATGVHKRFDTDTAELEYERTVRAGNGEDVLYVFHARAAGRTLLLPYNLVRTEVATPTVCHGYSMFEDGTMVVLRAMSEEPTRVHPLQVWRTPFVSDVYAAAQPVGTGPVHRVGNAELVRGISECLAVRRMVDEMRPAAAVFEAVIAACTRTVDLYHWLGDPELDDPAAALAEVRATAEQVLDEFDKVTALTAQATAAVDGAADEAAALMRRARAAAHRTADDWVRMLAELRRAQGQLVTVRELRYVDTERIDALDGELAAALTDTGHRAVEFLSGADAFAAYRTELDDLLAQAEAIASAAAAEPLRERLSEQTDALRIVTDVVGSLDITDATVRTTILTRIGEVLAGVNRVRATLDTRRAELAAVEGRAAFAAEYALLGQSVSGGLAVCDSPEACDDQLAKLLLAIENLESRFGEFDDFAEQLGAKREDVYEAFAARKQALLDERARRGERLADSAQRILSGVGRRAAALGSLDEVNTYFASDPMVARLRTAVADLRALGDQVRAEEFEGKLRAARQEAGRALRDRTDLYADGGETLRLGRHRFAVDTRPVELTMVPHEDALWYAITGTDYRAPVRDSGFEATRPYWSQLLVSETAEVYRGEYLAVSILAAAEHDGGLDALHAAAAAGELAELVGKIAADRYDEGYERGVHDHDAAAILDAALRLSAGAGLLRYPPAERAAAQLWWRFALSPEQAAYWRTRAGSLARARAVFGRTTDVDEVCAELASGITCFADDIGLDPVDAHLAGEYLFEELATPTPGFVTSAGARRLLDRFHRALDAASATGRAEFEADLRALADTDPRRPDSYPRWAADHAPALDGRWSPVADDGNAHATDHHSRSAIGPSYAVGGHSSSVTDDARSHDGRTRSNEETNDRHSRTAGGHSNSTDARSRAVAGRARSTDGSSRSVRARSTAPNAQAAVLAPSGVSSAPVESLPVTAGTPGSTARYQLIRAWLTAYLDRSAADPAERAVLPEAVAIELCGSALPRYDSAAALTATVGGLLGTHPRITGRELRFRLDELLARCGRFHRERVPGFRAYLRRRTELVAAERERLRLAEYHPRALSGFVRNRLIDEVYLPLIGDNLAKQLGVAGDADRVDRSGLLLLISPPGYGKTTLMEYVAARLGLVLVKVNGPALGHEVTSIDPEQAPHATARQELEKINFALELGNNVLLYLDDIQHTSPELLQKFISLCDGQRRMEGVWEGRTRTYDLRGKRFAVCMAGNPYTEQGKRFRIPDMLANRADVWNLGDVLSGRDEQFALSYLENALTSNSVLAPLSSRDRGDLEILVRLARGDRTATADGLAHPYPAAELAEITAVLGKLLRVQEVVLAVNRAYIASAATADAARTEPPFQLQGSYRNMNALAERVVPVMNDRELEALIDDHYLGEAQTLAAATEANLLKLAELRGTLTPDQARRWTEVKSAYLREQALGGAEDDPLVRAIGALGLLGDRIGGIESALRALESTDSGRHHRAAARTTHQGAEEGYR
ncbi:MULTISPECIES: DNA repair ATPase [unclassified Nocardia]|uniref:DNA repair ATPase n=1 Tax=unclassified Nocardia TaxID=2637762 RepID=UPI0024A8A674|nr:MULTISPECIES: DNA repair ATPase [unclassified Nocardia]